MTLDAEAHRFDTTMHRARARVAALDRALDALVALRRGDRAPADGDERGAASAAGRRQVFDALLDELER